MIIRLLSLLPCLLVAGCFSLGGLGEQGTDIAQLRVGQSRAEVEALLGLPVREQQDADGGVRAIYNYQIVDKEIGARAGLLIFEVVTLGAFSMICSIEGQCPGATHETRELLLHYDQANQLTKIESVLGEELKAK